MLRAIARNAILFGGLVVGATITGLAAPMLMSGRGALGPGVLDAIAPGRALLAVLVALGTTAAVAIVVSRACNTAVGMFAGGGALFGLAWRLATVDEVVHSGSFGGAALETALWAVAILGLAVVVFRVGGPLRDVYPDEKGRHPHPLLSGEAVRAAAAGALMIPVVWIVAQSPLKGQVLGAVFLGGMAAGAVGRLLAPHVQPILLFASPVLFGAVGQLIGIALIGESSIEALVTGSIPKLNLPMPVDFAAGTLMGVAVGLGWARSFMHHEPEHERELVAPSEAVR